MLQPGALAMFALARCLRGEPDWRGWPAGLVACGVLVIACFVASTVASALDATGAMPNAPTGLLQRVTVVAGWGALAAVSWRLGWGSPVARLYSPQSAALQP